MKRVEVAEFTHSDAQSDKSEHSRKARFEEEEEEGIYSYSSDTVDAFPYSLTGQCTC